MLFFDDATVTMMKARFADSRWPDFTPEFLLQPAPPTLQGGYDVLRWNGRAFATARTTDAKFASWIITENSVAAHLSDGDPQYLHAATAWVRAVLHTEIWQPQFKGNADLFHGNLLYALAMFLDLCGESIDPALRTEVQRELRRRGATALEWFTCKPPHEHRYTQNHFYIPLTGLLCAAIVLNEKSWIDELSVYPSLIFNAMGRDGFFFEGPDYFHYAFIWAVRLGMLSEKHLGLSASAFPCFAKLHEFLRWMYFPKGDCIFAIGDASAKEYNYSRWSEQESGQKLMSDNRLQNFSHVLMYAGESELAWEIKSRGAFHWYEGFWSLAWEGAKAATRASGSGAEASGLFGTHLFEDYGIWCCDASSRDSTLRVIAKCGAPLGRSIPMQDGKPAFKYDAGHCHPDAGSVLAAIDDVPVLLGPGYLGRKSGGYLNTLTFDGRGQEDDRLYHALDAMDYARFSGLSLEVTGSRQVMMEFAKAYPAFLGIKLARRCVELKSAGELLIEDHTELDSPRRTEARFRISDPPVEIRPDCLIWRVGQRLLEFQVVNSSSECEMFVSIGEVISINDDGRSGPFEAGSINQRGYQILVRPKSPVREWQASYIIRADRVHS